MKLDFRTGKVFAPSLSAVFLAFLSVMPGFAGAANDPANDFLPSFAGPHNGDLDVLSANVTLAGNDFDFTATLNGPVGESAGAVYVFGLDRGKGTAKFANIGEGGVIFDSTFVINTAGASTVNDLIGKTSTTISDVTLSGSTISGVVPVSDLVSEGFTFNQYTWNLWPEFGAKNAGNTEISDFAPDDSDALVSSSPEPGTMSLFGIAAVGAYALMRRRKSA